MASNEAVPTTPNPTPTPIPMGTPGLIWDGLFEDDEGLGDEEDTNMELDVDIGLKEIVTELDVVSIVVGAVGVVNLIFQPTMAMAPTVELCVRLVVFVCHRSELSAEVDA